MICSRNQVVELLQKWQQDESQVFLQFLLTDSSLLGTCSGSLELFGSKLRIQAADSCQAFIDLEKVAVFSLTTPQEEPIARLFQSTGVNPAGSLEGLRVLSMKLEGDSVAVLYAVDDR